MNATTKTTKRAVAQRVYQLRISLDEADPSIWRRLWVPGTLTLAKLDLVIQTAMGWTNSHLHEFNIDGRRYGMVDDEWPSDEPVLEDKRHKLDKVLGDVKEFTYTYDFGDNWLHIVTVEQVLAANDMNCWPMCLDGRNACPPEDVGGMGGYEEFREALQDPTHEEHDAMWRWAGGPFDPAGFDRNAVNAAIRKLKI